MRITNNNIEDVDLNLKHLLAFEERSKDKIVLYSHFMPKNSIFGSWVVLVPEIENFHGGWKYSVTLFLEETCSFTSS